MKKMRFFIVLLLICLCCALALAACDEEPEVPGNGGGNGNQTEQSGNEGNDDTPHTHAYGDWIVTTPATCNLAGTQTRTCSCGENETQPITATGKHAYSTSNVCTVCNIPLQYTEWLTYEINADHTSYTVTGIFQPIDELINLVIPPYHEELPVTGIGEYAFMGCERLTSVTLPSSVTSIGDWAFQYCNRLPSIMIPSSVTSVGDYAFECCYSLISITIPSDVISIGEHAFGDCFKLTEVCNLSSLNITKGSMDHGGVGYYAKNVYTATEGESKLFANSDGYVFYHDETDRYLASYMGKDTKLTLPENCNGANYAIGRFAFAFCDDLISVTIPLGVSIIGEGAFSLCENLTLITIPTSVTSIGEGAFYNCSNLTAVYYGGSASDWNTLSSNIGSNNDKLTSATRYYYSATQPTVAGNWWYYDNDGKPTVWPR